MESPRRGGLHPHRAGGERDQDIEGWRRGMVSGKLPPNDERGKQAELDEQRAGDRKRPRRRPLRRGRYSHADGHAEHEPGKGNHRTNRTRKLTLADRDAKEHEVTGHIGREDSPEREKTDRVGAARGSGER